MSVRAIERHQKVSPEQFERDFLSGLGTPVIVTDALDRWPAKAKWTFSFLRSTYGRDSVMPRAGLASQAMRMMTLAEYIDYIDSPSQVPPGYWVHPSLGIPLKEPHTPPESPLYLLDWNAYSQHPEIRDDVQLSPYFADDWLPLLPASLRLLLQESRVCPICWILIGPCGSLSKLHRDFWKTHVSLGLLQGRKKYVLVPADQTEMVYDGAVDPERPDFDRHPLFRNATRWECVLEPGETLFVPGGWWHAARGLEKSITVSYNFFNRTNVGDYVAGIFRHLPALVREFERVPNWQALLGANWTSKGFDEADHERNHRRLES